MKKSGYRFYEIDFLRFFAALMVVFFHYTFRGYAADSKSVLYFPYLGEVFRYGYLGVSLFFMISGYVILMSAYNKKSSEFIISRIVRLYPAYWFAVTLTFISIMVIGGVRYRADLYQYILNLTMMHRYIGVTSLDGVYWTLMVEMKFYLLIAIIIFMKQIHNIKSFLGLWMVLTLVLIKYNISYLGIFLIPASSSLFIAGAYFYLIYREGISLYKVSIIAVSFIVTAYIGLWEMRRFYMHYHVVLNAYVILSIIASFYLIFFMIALRKTQFINSRKFVVLGVLTYPLYLIHQNIGFMIFNYLGPYGLNKYVILSLVLALMLAAAHVIHKQIEKRYSAPLAGSLFKLVGGASKVRGGTG